MTNNNIEERMLAELYNRAYRIDMENTINLREFADAGGEDYGQVKEAYYELHDKGLANEFSLGGYIVITADGIIYCENNQLVDVDLANHQQQIRTQLLDAAMTSFEKHGRNALIEWTQWCHEANVKEQDFRNNRQLLVEIGMITPVTLRCFQITQIGMETIKDYRHRVARRNSFKDLCALNHITAQQRGHRLEDILTELVKGEGWDAQQNVRSQGQEQDIVIHKQLDYYFISCKWEKDPIQPKEVELLESRVRSRANTNGGLLFSMSGFTDNCIVEAQFKIPSAQIMLFGPTDINRIFMDETKMTDLLYAKLQQAMHHRKILVDGLSY